MMETFSIPLSQKMASQQNFLLNLKGFLKEKAAFSTFPLSFLMIGIEKLIELEWKGCCDVPKDDLKQTCRKAIATCLALPAIWIFLLLLHGEYVACGMTTWNGVNVFDKELNRTWCKPSDRDDEKVLRQLTLKHFYTSQIFGYAWISAFSVFGIILVGWCDCLSTGKCGSVEGQSPPNPTDAP
ncbi:hypothetical protein DNTS_016379 [Danionella cerebrum]|uniref:Uncharacterized protein n=1 Tax=Danionella cerebrum TaxID=2873325 RepID=A0A553PXK8_9TELE|nr:hypothetical protein DNTS_016379 [Danionella translucida]